MLRRCLRLSWIRLFSGPALSEISSCHSPPRTCTGRSGAAPSLLSWSFTKGPSFTGKASRFEDAQSRAAYLVDQMRQAFDDAEIEGWEGLEGTYGLADRNDEHVVAAAVVGGAGAIVTANLKDFPIDRLPSGLQVLSAPSLRATPSL
jgi:hypothetical protein